MAEALEARHLALVTMVARSSWRGDFNLEASDSGHPIVISFPHARYTVRYLGCGFKSTEFLLVGHRSGSASEFPADNSLFTVFLPTFFASAFNSYRPASSNDHWNRIISWDIEAFASRKVMLPNIG